MSTDQTQQIRADIEQQREELAETVDALTAKLDVKARARERVRSIRAAATDDQGRPTPPVLAGTAAVAAVVVAGVVLIVRRRR
jgi:hypothetical protein